MVGAFAGGPVGTGVGEIGVVVEDLSNLHYHSNDKEYQ